MIERLDFPRSFLKDAVARSNDASGQCAGSEEQADVTAVVFLMLIQFPTSILLKALGTFNVQCF
jgi:hypothetical protein